MAGDDPYRLTLMKAITSALEEITIDNGYKHDMAGRIFRGRTTFGPSDPIPMISIVEGGTPLEQTAPPPDSQSDFGPFELLIQGFVVDDVLNPTDPAYRLLADVRKRLTIERDKYTRGQGFNRFGLGNTVLDIVLGRGICRPPDEISAKAYFWLTVNLSIVENAVNPYDETIV